MHTVTQLLQYERIFDRGERGEAGPSEAGTDVDSTPRPDPEPMSAAIEESTAPPQPAGQRG